MNLVLDISGHRFGMRQTLSCVCCKTEMRLCEFFFSISTNFNDLHQQTQKGGNETQNCFGCSAWDT